MYVKKTGYSKLTAVVSVCVLALDAVQVASAEWQLAGICILYYIKKLKGKQMSKYEIK